MPFKDKSRKKEYVKEYWKKNMFELSKKAKKYKEDNKEKIKNLRRKYLEENRDMINKKAREKYKNNSAHREKRLIRNHTILKHGKLKKGFVYHHNTTPYHIDKYLVLEKGFHEFYHRKMPQLIKNIDMVKGKKK